MQAAVLHQFGSLAQNLRIEQRPKPALKKGQVLVRLKAASINPSDLVFLFNRYGIKKRLPIIPGFEGSGIVEAASSPDTRALLGKRVACHAPEDGDGTWADYMACPVSHCIPLKKQVSFEQGAALYVNPMTAWYLLQRVREKKHRAFIQTAAASALGRMMARLAKHQRIPAIHVVRRHEHIALLKKEGAAYVLDSSAHDFMNRLKTLAQKLHATIALDPVGGSLTAALAQALQRGGEIVVYGALAGRACEVSPADLIFRGISVSGFWLTQLLKEIPLSKKQRAFARVQDLLGTTLKTHVQERLPLEHIHAAIERYKEHRAKGKVLLVFP